MGYSYSKYDPGKDIPSLKGKTILITGANIGIGKQTSIFLAKHEPAHLYIGARNQQTGQETVDEIKAFATKTSVHLLPLDLSSFASIKKAAKHFLTEAQRLDILILNAGMMAGPAATTPEGYEKQMGTNHVGHALLLKLLTPTLQTTLSASPDTKPRIVILSSIGHKSGALPIAGINISTLKTAQEDMSGVSKYCQSKLANVIYARQFAKHNPQFMTVAVHPGEVKTSLFSTGNKGGGWMMTLINYVIVPLIATNVEDGSKNSCWAATADGVENGRYYEPVAVVGKGSKLSKDEDLGRRFWEWTEKELEGHDV